MRKPIIISDLDGTLLTSTKCIPRASRRWIDHWLAQGGQFVIATGRHYRNIVTLFDACPTPPHLISANGAMINNRLTRPLKDCQVHHLDELDELAQHHRVHFSVFTNAGWHVTSRNAMVNAHDFEAIMTGHADFLRLPAFKGLFYGCPAELQALQHHLSRHFSHLQAVRSDPHWLEIQCQGINKFSALQTLLGQLGLTQHPTLAFGDGLNDVELLAGCSQGVIMGNAMPELRAALPTLPVTLSNDLEGVRVYLESMPPC